MAIRFYDKALVEKIQKWIADPNLRILKPNETTRLFQTLADLGDDKPIQLPVISIQRDPTINVTIPTKRPMTFNGVKISDYTGDELPDKINIMHLDAIPIEINYQIDIYTRKYEEGDEYIRNFIFNFVNYPRMTVTIPYNGANIEHVCYTRLNSTVSDNSDVPNKLFPDQFTRWTMNIRIDDAYLFSVPVSEAAKIGQVKMNIDSGDTDSEDSYIKLVVEDETTSDRTEELVFSDRDKQ